MGSFGVAIQGDEGALNTGHFNLLLRGVEDMTYEEFIQNILYTRGRFGIPEGEYKERHHIIPKCMGGTNDKNNLIDLYAKEHFIAHKLLAEENYTNNKIVSAYWQMATKNTISGKIFLTPEEYEEARLFFINNVASKSKSDETRQKLSELAKLRTGNKNPMFGRHHTEESKRKMSENSIGKSTGKRSEETCKNIGDALRGKPKSEIAKLHDSEAQKKYWKNMPVDRYEKECKRRSITATGENNPKAIKIKCIETGKIFGCIKYASKEYNIDYIKLKKCIKGLLDTAGGYHWEKV